MIGAAGAAALYNYIFNHDEEEKISYSDASIPMSEKENGDC